MIQLWESGIVQFEIKRLNFKATHCLTAKKLATGYKKIKLVDTSSAFFLLGLGIVCSILIFMIETFKYCFWKVRYPTKLVVRV